jgi:hypothetical protein
VELGVGTFLLAGVASSGVVGLTPYLIDGVGQDVFLRLGIGLGESTGSITHMTWAAGRLDTCLAMPGNYAAGSGLQFDLCGGADVGFTVIALDTQPLSLPQRGQTLPYVNLGPSADLRAEFGANAAFSLRGVLGINIARDPYFDGSGSRVDPPLGAARVELGFSWKLQ